MSLVTERIEDHVLYLELNGRIDSTNADQAEEWIKAIREAHVCPEHITFTLSASSSLLKEGEDMPDYFTTTSKSRATFRKPRHVDNTPDEFTENDFQ